jgi:hypothetical protein
MRKRITPNPKKQIPHNNGKRLVTDAAFAKTVNNPVRMYVISKMDAFSNTLEGMTATADDNKVSSALQ